MTTLTEKEKRIIELKAEGKTVKQIARALTVSTRSAHKIINQLYAKTGTNNSGSIVDWGHKNKIFADNLPVNDGFRA